MRAKESVKLRPPIIMANESSITLQPSSTSFHIIIYDLLSFAISGESLPASR